VYANRIVTELCGETGELPPDDYADAYRSLFERSGLCMAVLDARLVVREANEAFTAELGGDGVVVEGRDLFEFFEARTEAELRRELMKLAAGWTDRVVSRVHVARGADQRIAVQLTAVATKAEVHADARVVVVLHWDDVDEEVVAPIGRLELTELHARILKGVAMGMSTISLANRLYLSRQGVEYHVGTMLRKFKVGNRPALISRAYSIGVLDVRSWPPQVSPKFIK
jgi:DNA-binding CsgD family transcriptional regulator